MFELELDARGQECRTFEQPTDQWVNAILENAAKPFSYSRIGIRKFTGLLVEQLKFPIIEIEKFAVHAHLS